MKGYRYQKALDEFERVYFPKDKDFREYWKTIETRDLNTTRDNLNRSIASTTGRSAFAPTIIRTKDKEFLGLHKLGKFVYDSDKKITYIGNERRIDITGLNKEEILKRVKKMLDMTNAEIMRVFKIDTPYFNSLKIPLLIDDIVQDYITENNFPVMITKYSKENGIINDVNFRGQVTIKNEALWYTNNGLIRIYRPGAPVKSLDEIVYTVSNPEEKDLNKLKVSIDKEKLEITTPLGEQLLNALQKREKEKPQKEPEEI